MPLLESLNPFVDKILDLFVSFIGVMLGGYAAFRIARWQLAKEAENEAKNDEQATFVALKRIEWELIYNSAQVNRLQEVIQRAEESRMDLWRWAVVTIDFMTRVAYDDFLRSGLPKRLPQSVQDDLFTAYSKSHYLAYLVKQEAAAQEFYQAHKASKNLANQQLEEVQKYIPEVHDFIWLTIKAIRNSYPKDGQGFEYSGLTISYNE